jgi:hypothetical protein
MSFKFGQTYANAGGPLYGGKEVVNTFSREDTSDAVAKAYSGNKLQATKYSRYGEREEGMASALDGGILKRNITREMENWGDGFVKFQVMDKTGTKTDPSKPLNIGGRMFFPDANGLITIVDEDFLDKQVEIENEKRKYLESLIVKASVSDEVCSLMLGKQNVGELLGANTDGGGVIIDPDLIAVNALPSALETYDPTSIAYSRAVQKFKLVIKANMPVIQKMTPDSAEHAE